MSSKKGFQLPPLDKLHADNVVAFNLIKESSEKGDDLGDFHKIGFTIGRTAIEGVTNQEPILTNVIQKYKKVQKDVAALGILSGEARVKEGTMQRMYCSSALSFEALNLDHDALALVRPFLEKEPEGTTYMQIPSPYFFGSENDSLWRHIHAPESCKYVAITAITAFSITMVAHSKALFDEWDQLIAGGKGDPIQHPKSHILSTYMQEALTEKFNDLSFDITAGQTIITHRSMPLKLGPVEEAKDFIVKTSVFELVKTNKTRYDSWEGTLEKGRWTVGHFDEQFFYKLFTPIETFDSKDFLMKIATPDQVPWLTVKPKPVAGSAKKQPAIVMSDVDEQKKNDNNSNDKNNDSDNDGDKKKTDKKTSKKQQREESDKQSSSSSSPSSSPSVTKKTKTATTTTTKKSNGYQEAKQKYTQLKEQIAKLNPLVWNPAFEVKADEKNGECDESSNGNSVKKFNSALATLAKKISEAQKHEQTLPGALEKLDKIQTLLDEIDAIADKNGKEDTSLASRVTKLSKLKAAKNNLWPSESKMIDSLLADSENLKTTIEKRKVATEAKNKEKKRARNDEEATGNGSSHGSGGGATEQVIIIPEINEDELDPQIVTGVKEYGPLIKKYNQMAKDYEKMTQHLDHPGLHELYRKFAQEDARIIGEVRKKVESVDLALYVAYGSALETIYEQKKNGGKTVATETAAVKKKLECNSCHEKRFNFDESGYCKECYVQEVVMPWHIKVGKREELLAKLSRKEADQKGPHHTTKKKWEQLSEQLERVIEKLDNANSGPSVWQKFRSLQQQAEEMLPKMEGSDNDDDEDGEDYDDDEEDESGDSMIDDGPLPNSVLSLKNLPDDEEEAKFSDEESDKKSKKKKHKSDDSDLAHQTLLTMAKLPVEKLHKDLLKWYVDPEQHSAIKAELEKVKDTKEIYGIKLESQNPDDKDDEPTYHHEFFLDRSEAAKLKRLLHVDGKIKATVEVKRV